MIPTLITGNTSKLLEFKNFIPELESVKLDLIEVQGLDPKHILASKLQEALNQVNRPVIVDDVSFYMDCIPGLPGPMIKWFLETLGAKGIYEMAQRYNLFEARAVCLIGLAVPGEKFKFFEGVVEGLIVPPRGENGFGFDTVFQPKGSTQTYAEMNINLKNQKSHRGIALSKLKDYLSSNINK